MVDVINLVIVMKPTATFGTATAVNLYYESDGTRAVSAMRSMTQVPEVGRAAR